MPLASGRKIQVRRDVELRLALEDQLADDVVVAAQLSRDARIERRFHRRQTADRGHEGAADPVLPGLEIGRGVDRLAPRLALRGHRIDTRQKVQRQHLAVLVAQLRAVEDAKVFRLKRARRREQIKRMRCTRALGAGRERARQQAGGEYHESTAIHGVGRTSWRCPQRGRRCGRCARGPLPVRYDYRPSRQLSDEAFLG